jgi:RNA polymerase sigma-70 factor, ECF subfamily
MGASEAGALTEAFERERRGLFAHAYRMLGAYHEAEDVVQDTYVRALRGWQTFERRSSVRTWLYRITTNVCLNVIESHGRRARSFGLAPDDLAQGDLGPWLEPFPTDPADLVTARESVRLAFVAGLQHLAPRQRAVLLLREVLAFSAAETGEALGMSVPAVKSALQRARARLDEAAPARDDVLDATSPRARELLAGYMAGGRRPTPTPFARCCARTRPSNRSARGPRTPVVRRASPSRRRQWAPREHGGWWRPRPTASPPRWRGSAASPTAWRC